MNEPKKKTPEELQNIVLGLIFQMSKYYPENKTIMTNLTTISKELNLTQIKLIHKP